METSLAPSPIANVLEPIPFEIFTTTSDFCNGVTLQQSTAEHFEAIWMNFSVSFFFRFSNRTLSTKKLIGSDRLKEPSSKNFKTLLVFEYPTEILPIDDEYPTFDSL